MKTGVGLLAGVLLVSLLLPGCLQNQQEKDRIRGLEDVVQGLQGQLEALGQEKNNTARQFSSEKQLLESDYNAKLAASKKERDAVKARELESIKTLKRILEASPVNKSILNETNKLYKEWDFYACSYYLGANLLTTGGNVTVPLQCVLATGQYMYSSKQLLDSLNSVEDRSADAVAEILKRYPNLNSS